jgi:hypothetical protein
LGDLGIKNIFSQVLQLRVRGINEYKTMGFKQSCHPLGKSFNKRPAGLVGRAQLRQNFRFEFGIMG